jgi:hypothetical protein
MSLEAMRKDHTAISGIQLAAEEPIRLLLREEYGDLKPGKIILSDGSHVSVDGLSDDGLTIVEIFCRQGSLLDGQKKKVARDILKLAMLKAEDPERRVVFCYANTKLEGHLKGGSWLAKAATHFQVELKNLQHTLPKELEEDLEAAQRLQATNRGQRKFRKGVR